MTTLVDRLFQRLPEVHRRMDAADSTWTLKRYLGAMLADGGLLDDTIVRIAGEQPVGPGQPEPWALRGEELAQWQANRVRRSSALADPDQADVAWLPWLAQLVGSTLDPSASEQEKRDTIRYATSGWRGGTRSAIADAAKTALTGSKYARIVPHMIPVSGSLNPGTIWDITIVTRTAETPDPGAVLDAVLRKGVKPAGVVLHHAAYGASWDQIEAAFPQWNPHWESLTWDELEQAGLMYVPVPDNVVPNPSFEVNATGWAAGANSSIGRVLGGVDGVAMCRVTATGAGAGNLVSPDIPVTPGNASFSFSVRPDQTRTVSYTIKFYNGVTYLSGSDFTQSYPATPADEWFRAGTSVTVPVPATTTKMITTVTVTGMGAAELYDVDAFYARNI
jgi:Phage tail protein (Tail_P2_I)